MKRASISDAKNRLSALLDRVRHGASIVIEDRGVPVARLEPVVGPAGADGRRARLLRHGVLRLPVKRLPPKWLDQRPPRLLNGRRASAILIEERGDSR